MRRALRASGRRRCEEEWHSVAGLQWHAAGRALYVARSGIETAERLMTMLMLRDALPLSAQLPCACPTPRNRRWDTLALQERTLSSLLHEAKF